jgi:hypothetical protein
MVGILALGNHRGILIVASQLNRRAVPISAGRDAKRKVKRKNNLISPDCSISRFIVDVERLLTDLYGDAEGEDFHDLAGC